MSKLQNFARVINLLIMITIFFTYEVVQADVEKQISNKPELLKCFLIYDSKLRFDISRSKKLHVTPVMEVIPMDREVIYFIKGKDMALINSAEGKKLLLRLSEQHYIENVEGADEIVFWVHIKKSELIPYDLISKTYIFDYAGPKFFTKIFSCL